MHKQQQGESTPLSQTRTVWVVTLGANFQSQPYTSKSAAEMFAAQVRMARLGAPRITEYARELFPNSFPLTAQQET